MNNKNKMKKKNKYLTKLLLGSVAGMAMAASSAWAYNAEEDPIKVGVMMPFSGIYAALGDAGRNGLKLAIEEQGNQLSGRSVEFIEMDTEAHPARAPEITSSLVDKDEVDFVVGPVHSGVAMGMTQIMKRRDAIMIIPNAGANAATGALCAPNIFRTSFSSWQTAYPMGKVAVESGYKRIVTMTWNYGFGKESVAAFEESYKANGGEIIKNILVPFPKTEFQSYLTEIASLKPDAVFVFFAGGGAVKFVKDYAAMGLKGKIPLLGSGFLTEGTLEAQGESAEGVLTTLHYADSIDTPENLSFREKYKEKFGKEADLYAAQGYDAGLLIAQAVNKLSGDTSDKKALIQAMESTTIDSPRGPFKFSRAHNPIQDIYLRKVEGGQNVIVKTAAEDLEDPARGCKL